MELPGSRFYRILAPRPVVLVSTRSKNGIANAAPFSFVMPVSMDPPLVAIASQPAHDTMNNIRETKEFVINIPPESVMNQLWKCSEKFPADVSEIAEAGLTEASSREVNAPRVKECIGWFECKMDFDQVAGDHVLVVGKVLTAEVKDEYWSEEGFDLLKARPLLHLSGKKFALATDINTVED